MEEQSRKMQEQIDKQNKEWAEKEQKKWEEQQKRRKEEEEERERKEWEEEERKRKEEEEEEDIIKNPNRVRIDILAALNKEKVKKIVKACPKRTSLSLNQFRDHFKKVTSNLTEEEKAYALF